MTPTANAISTYDRASNACSLPATQPDAAAAAAACPSPSPRLYAHAAALLVTQSKGGVSLPNISSVGSTEYPFFDCRCDDDGLIIVNHRPICVGKIIAVYCRRRWFRQFTVNAAAAKASPVTT
jgi:hypothetical protein